MRPACDVILILRELLLGPSYHDIGGRHLRSLLLYREVCFSESLLLKLKIFTSNLLLTSLLSILLHAVYHGTSGTLRNYVCLQICEGLSETFVPLGN